MCLGLAQSANTWMSEVSIFLEMGYLRAQTLSQSGACPQRAGTLSLQLWIGPGPATVQSPVSFSKRTMLPSCWARHLLIVVVFFRVKVLTISKGGYWLGFQELPGSRAPCSRELRVPVYLSMWCGHEPAPSNCLIYVYLEVLAAQSFPFSLPPSSLNTG